MFVPPDNGPTYDRNMWRLTKYTKNKFCIKFVFLYTIISGYTVNKTFKKNVLVSRSKAKQYSSCQIKVEHQLFAKISLPICIATDTELVGGFENSTIIQFISLSTCSCNSLIFRHRVSTSRQKNTNKKNDMIRAQNTTKPNNEIHIIVMHTMTVTPYYIIDLINNNTSANTESDCVITIVIIIT